MQKEPITKSMKHKYKGLKEGTSINKENKMYRHQNTKKTKKIQQISWLFRVNPFVLHPAHDSALDLSPGSPIELKGQVIL